MEPTEKEIDVTREDELKNQIRLEGFPAKVRSQLQLIKRYFQHILQDPDESARFAFFSASGFEIKSACKELEGGKKPKIAGQIIDGYLFHEEDFHAIYDSVENVLEEIRDIINSNPEVIKY